MSDIGTAIADASTAVAEANEKIIDELPGCLVELQTAIEKMDLALAEFYTLTSTEFDTNGGDIRFVQLSEGTATGGAYAAAAYGQTQAYYIDQSDTGWKWSFDMCGVNVPYAASLGVNSSRRPTGGVTRQMRSVVDCWTHFNKETSNAALIIKNAFNSITRDVSIDQYQELNDMTPDRQNELISLVFTKNHGGNTADDYILAGAPFGSPFNTRARRGDFSSTIAGQVWPGFTLADNSPDDTRGVADRYYLASTVSEVSDDFTIETAAEVDEGLNWATNLDSYGRVHPYSIFDDAHMAIDAGTADGGLSSTARISAISRFAKLRIQNTSNLIDAGALETMDTEGMVTSGRETAVIGGDSISASRATEPKFWQGYTGDGLGYAHFCLGGEPKSTSTYNIVKALTTLPDGVGFSGDSSALRATLDADTWAWNSTDYSAPALAYISAKPSHVFKAFFGDYTTLDRPELINWWINPEIGASGRVFNWKSSPSNAMNQATDTQNNTFGNPSNLVDLHGARYSNGARSNPSAAENQSYVRWFEWGGAAKNALYYHEIPQIHDSIRTWSNGYMFGTNTTLANKTVVYTPPASSRVPPFPSDINEGPIIDLRDKYFQVKAAFLGGSESVRKASQCILQLAIERDEARTALNLTARSALSDPAATDTEREAARNAINTLAATSDDFAGGTRGFNSSLIFREQCFLMANLPSLAEHSKRTSTQAGTRKALPYGPYTGTEDSTAVGTSERDNNASICVDARNPFAFMNALSVGATDEAFFDMTSKDISTLQPMIQLYKVLFDEETKTEHSQKIKFDTFANTSETIDFIGSSPTGTLLENKQKRGFGVGIQSFDFKYAGSNPFAVKRSISATLKIFANGFDELLRERRSRIIVDGEYQEKKYRYIDLALKTSNTGRAAGDTACDRELINQENEEYAKLNFRLKAVVGWAYPEGGTEHMSDGVKDALFNSFTTLNLTPTVHDFQFDEQGRVIFTINYLAYVDDFFDQDDYNVFLSPEIYSAQEERRIQMAEFDCSSEEAQATARQNAIPEIDREKTQSIATLISDLVSKNKIYYVQRSYEDIRNFVAEGPFFNTSGGDTVVPISAEELNDNLETEIAAALEGYSSANPSESMDAVRASLATVSPNSVNVPYFYLRDLCDIVLARIGSSLNQIILGSEDSSGASIGSRIIAEADEAVAEVDAAIDSASAARAAELLDIEIEPLTFDPADPTGLGRFTRAPDAEATPSTLEADDMFAGTVLAGVATRSDPIIAAETEPDLPSYPYFSDDDSLDETYGAELADLIRTGRHSRITRAQLDDPEYLATLVAREVREMRESADELSATDCRRLAQYIKLIRLEAEFKKFRMVLGPVELFDPKNDSTSYTVNFGDVPVSVKYFTEFLTEKLSTKEQTIYPMANFFNDLMNGLVRNFLNDDTCFTSLNSSQRVTLNSASITGFNPGITDEITDLINETSGENAAGRLNLDDVVADGSGPIINVSGNSRLPDASTIAMQDIEKNYMIFFAARTRPSPGLMVGNRISDHRAGIYHYELGREKGIVKTISLTKTETPGLQEVRFEQDGYDGLRQLRVVYDVNIETFANVHAYPGTYIFVNPRSFAPSSTLAPCNEFNLTEYGIGGYYMIITSEHSFGPGRANTKIYAKWVAEIGGTGRNCSDSAAGGGRINRCGT